MTAIDRRPVLVRVSLRRLFYFHEEEETVQCPVCDERLREVERYGVMVDTCSSCKGVWLDRGGLEKAAAMEERDEYCREDRDDRDDRGRDRYDGYHG